MSRRRNKRRERQRTGRKQFQRELKRVMTEPVDRLHRIPPRAGRVTYLDVNFSKAEALVMESLTHKKDAARLMGYDLASGSDQSAEVTYKDGEIQSVVYHPERYRKD